jgi:RHS repeat-associated protein
MMGDLYREQVLQVSGVLKALCFLVIFVFSQLSLAESEVYFVHNDHLGTPQILTKHDQSVVWKAEYKPFGDAVINEDPDGDGNTVEFNIRFPGQYYDKETGYYYNYYRTYDPSLGRYIQSDPIGILEDYSDPQMQVALHQGIPLRSAANGGGLNHVYGYVEANPIRYIDPLGLRYMGIPQNEEEAREMYPGSRPLSECTRCRIRHQALCALTGGGMARTGMATGSAVGSLIPGIGTAAGGTAGTAIGFVGGMGVCQQIQRNACSSVCEEDEEGEETCEQ